MAHIGQRGLREVIRLERLQDNVARDELFEDGDKFWIHDAELLRIDGLPFRVTLSHGALRISQSVETRPEGGAA